MSKKGEPRAKWTKEQEETLRRLYPQLGAKKLVEVLGYTQSAIESKAFLMGVKFHRDIEWTKELEQLVIDRYKEDGPQKLANLLGVSHWAVTAKARRLGVESTRKAPRLEYRDRKKKIIHGGRSKNADPRVAATYNCWASMISRPKLDPHEKSYHCYVTKGVKVCVRWRHPEKGFTNFLEDMGLRPNKLSVDRMDNGGDYTPSNCRWVTQKEQCNNQGKGHKEISGYEGVRPDRDSWCAEICFSGKLIKLGNYRKVTSAAFAYNIAYEQLYEGKKKLNKELSINDNLKEKICQCVVGLINEQLEVD